MPKTTQLDVEKMKAQLIKLNTAVNDMYTILLTVDSYDTVIKKGKYNANDVLISDISITKELISYANRKYSEGKSNRVVGMYDSFSEYFKQNHNIDITDKKDQFNYISPQRIGRLFSNLNTLELPYTIVRGKNATHRYYDIISKE